MKKYKVTYEYRGKVTIEVEAENESEAENVSLQEADDSIANCLSVYGVDVREVS